MPCYPASVELDNRLDLVQAFRRTCLVEEIVNSNPYLFRFFFSPPRELSSLSPQIPFGETLATKGPTRVERIRRISAHAETRMGAHIRGFLLFFGRKNTRH